MHTSVTASRGPIVWLGELPGDPGALGGKGASLDRLARLGFLIPPGFCVTTAAFAAHLAAVLPVAPQAPGAPAIDAVSGLPDEAARTTMVDLIRSIPAPAAVCDALQVALERLTAAGETSLAVRSSAIGEDGQAASYAGLHDTELGLSAADVEPAIRRCWSSLWSPAAVAYRRRRSLSMEGAAMAVVVQALVPADAAVVVFTRHPVTGRDDQLLVNAVRGLGEPMVSGTVTPDTYVIDKATGAVLDFSSGDAGERLFATDDGVARTIDPAGGPVLTSDVLQALVALSLDVERAFNAPVDIEAAFARDRWYLLQARPITTN